MPFYEIIYEPGTKSVAEYENDEEALSALEGIYGRATSGQPATPESMPHPNREGTPAVATWAAERPIKVFVYSEHPGDFEPQVDPSTLSGTNQEMLAQLRQAISPLADSPGAQDSQYKMEADRELDLNF